MNTDARNYEHFPLGLAADVVDALGGVRTKREAAAKPMRDWIAQQRTDGASS